MLHNSVFKVIQDSSNPNHAQSNESLTLSNAVHHLVCSNRSVQVLKAEVEARNQIPHDILSLHHLIL